MGSLDDTICAVATPMGEGGVGIVRVSGAQAIRFASKILHLRSGKPLEQIKSYQMHLAQFLWDNFHFEKHRSKPAQTVLDEVLVVAMRGPRSYTGEDVVEIHAHGGPVVVQALCEALTQVGARLAEPGEFTKRSFLNGRMDLTQAEAVLDTIRANSLQSLKLAQEHLQGGLSGIIQEHQDRLVKLLAHVEAGMDFGEEDIQFIDQGDLREALQQIHKRISMLADSAREGRIIREGIRTVIVGRPNVGKSSLLNAILGTDRAIVSRLPGTTRDVLEESIMVEGTMIRFFDTAGLRETSDELEFEGMSRATQAIEQADVLVFACDQSQELHAQDLDFIEKYAGQKSVLVLTKHDLPTAFTLEEFQHIIHQQTPEVAADPEGIQCVPVCALTGEGVDDVKQAIKNLAVGQLYETGDSVLVSRLRHKVLLENAANGLQNAMIAIDEAHSTECVALELRVAMNALGEIVGTVTNDDILDQVFREFCIGK